MNSHDHTEDCPVVLREIREMKREAREERKEMRAEIAGLRFEVGNLGKDMASLKAEVKFKTGLFGVIGGGGIHALLKLLGK